MSSAVEQYIAQRIRETPAQMAPFPHFFVENVFPEDYYAELRQYLPPIDNYIPIEESKRLGKGTSYPDRFIFSKRYSDYGALTPHARTFWEDFDDWFPGHSVFLAVAQKFAPGIRARFGDRIDDVELFADVLVVRDRTNYQIGPHTDVVNRCFSLLFYCPPDDSLADHGTSIYIPRDRKQKFLSRGHHDFADFVNVGTMPYRRNCLFGFLRTDNSFHGVERIEQPDIERDVILYNVRIKNPEIGASA